MLRVFLPTPVENQCARPSEAKAGLGIWPAKLQTRCLAQRHLTDRKFSFSSFFSRIQAIVHESPSPLLVDVSVSTPKGQRRPHLSAPRGTLPSVPVLTLHNPERCDPAHPAWHAPPSQLSATPAGPGGERRWQPLFCPGRSADGEFTQQHPYLGRRNAVL